MKTELLSVSKFRDGKRIGDDVPLVLPGVAYGVFDGATDPLGTVIDGKGAGRIAALATAGAMVRLMLSPEARLLPAEEIIARLSADLAAATGPLGLEIPPSTTMAVALDCGAEWRFLALGDTGIRLNGAEILRHEKILDDVSTASRVQVFRDLVARGADPETAEAQAREALLLGLDHAIAAGLIAPERASQIIAQAARQTGLDEAAQEVEAFLRGGIRVQFRLGNLAGHPLGFDTLNGTLPVRGEWIDRRVPKAEIHSIEIFSDGYPDLPAQVGAAHWEAGFLAAEESDYHKIGRFATVKGSTREQFFDDRTVLVLR